MKKRLGVCATEVPSDGQGTLNGNPKRIDAARNVLDRLAHWADMVHLLAFPAGFLRARSEEGLLETAAPLLTHARRVGLGVMFGVDTEPLRLLPPRRVREGTLPSFLVAWAPGMDEAVAWRQRSRTRMDARLVTDHAPRVLRVAGYDVAPLISGELASPGLREGLVRRQPEVTILCAHFNTGQHHWAGLDALRAKGVCSIRTVHAAHGTSQLLCAYRGYRLSNMMWREAGIFCFSYFIDDADHALDAA